MVCRSNRQGWNYRKGEVAMIDARRVCDCGSGKQRTPQFDGYDIFLTYTCDECYERKIKRFRSDIFTQYKTEERIEPEE